MVENDESPKSSRKRKHSDVWDHFEEVEVLSKKKKGEPERKVKCKACSKLYMYPKTRTTTTMKRHLDGCFAHHGEENIKKGQGTLNFDAADACGIDLPVVSFSGGYDHAKIRELIATMIIVHEYPFRMVEHFWFNVRMKTLNPSYQKTSRTTIKNECLQIFKSRKETLKKELKHVGKISLTCDLWTSNQTLCYMSLVAHYIDSEWNMQYRVISFLELEPPHTGIVISQAIFECLSDWKIEDKIATITLDNASSNDVAARQLMSKFKARGSVFFHGKFFHVRCSAHILNLLVSDGLKAIEPLIENIRQTVKYLKKSPSRLYKFTEIFKSLNMSTKRGLCLDVPTRWGSTYKMLEHAFSFKNAFLHYADLDANYKWEPSSEEWRLYAKIRDILAVLNMTTTMFSGSTYPTANEFFLLIVNVKKVLDDASASTDKFLHDMGNAMLQKFEKYWKECSTLLSIASILDPRYKMDLINFCFPKIYVASDIEHNIDSVSSTLKELYEHYESDHTANLVAAEKKVDNQAVASENGTSSNSLMAISTQFRTFMKTTAKKVSKSDLFAYLDEAALNHSEDFDVLLWWKQNSSRYPILSKVAKDILTVPVSTVSSESSFSTGGRVLDNYRSSLLPNTVEALVCSASWIRGSQKKKKANKDKEDQDDLLEVPFLDKDPSIVSTD
ncbi:unnamed protein product [Triticum turgidum subsp. durum]|uniref:BED-type domain-containing protein n=1 Tax=Triticum turgidum subsp. durum TaxID=4567 RepID=A0A9R0QPC0_TRITD|nr:unnamed protein product [Triticum turgidum subsp. durum]